MSDDTMSDDTMGAAPWPKDATDTAWIRWRWLLLAMLGFAGAIALGVGLAAMLPTGPYYRPGDLWHRLLSWDGIWYREVARQGYHWTADGSQLGHYENPDFFPGWPLLERLWMTGFGGSAGSILCLSLAFGAASVVSFARLTKLALDRLQAAGTPLAGGGRAVFVWAVLFYALWSGAYGAATGYPTGLINLCAAEALYAGINGRYWRAAAIAGLGTAVAPTMVFLAATLCLDRGLDWLRTRRWQRVPALIGFGLLSVAGLLGFMTYLAATFHDPLLFLKAQRAWGVPPPVWIRAILMIAPPWYLLPGWEALHAILHGTTNATAEIIYQRCLGMVTMFWVFALGLALLRPLRAGRWQSVALVRRAAAASGLGRLAGLPRLLLLDFAVSVLGYMWFLGTTAQNMTATPRLLYPVPVLILGIALAVGERKRLGIALLVLSALTLAAQIGFILAGYVVI